MGQVGMLAAFDVLIKTQVTAYLKASTSLGNPVAAQSSLVESLFLTQRSFLLASCGGRVDSGEEAPSMATWIQQIQMCAGEQVPLMKIHNSITHMPRLLVPTTTT